MKYLAPLLDVILGMLLAFVSIAAVSGKADGEADKEPNAQPQIDPVVLELRVQRMSPLTELQARMPEGQAFRSLGGIDRLDLGRFSEVELTVSDPELYRLLEELRQRGRTPRILYESSTKKGGVHE